MNESISSTFLYNMIIVFIVIVFAILAATLTYYKAFKVNNRIISSIEKFEGYNVPAKKEIYNTLKTIGYMRKDKHSCAQTKKGGTLEPSSNNQVFNYCVYYFDSNAEKNENTKYDNYGVVTYITLDIPIVNTHLSIPIFTKSNRIYRFNKEEVSEP